MSEEEIMGILDEMETHYEELSVKAEKEGKERTADRWEMTSYACRRLKMRIHTVFKNRATE